MRRFMVLVTEVLLMTAMLVVSSVAAYGKGVCAACTFDFVGAAVNPAACEKFADGSGMFAWRPGGVCWFTPPAM
jgi:hypothetical protein